jgi:hypothetical protein
MSPIRVEISDALNAEITKAIAEWSLSLPPAEANTPVTIVSGLEYTPLEILDHVQRKSEFGLKFLAGLHALHQHMVARKPSSSVVELIRRSVRDRANAARAGSTT